MLMDDFSIIVRYCKIFAERKMHDYEIGLSEQIILMYLFSQTKINQDTIAKHFMIDKGAVAKTLNKLENKCFIKRLENKENKREKLISITEKGKGLMGNMSQVLEEWNSHLYQGLSEDDIKNMQRIAGIMASNAITSVN